MILMVLFTLIRIYEFIIVVRVLLSWIQLDPSNPIVIWIGRLTEPVFEPFRRLIPMERIGLDVSPLIVLLLLELLKRLLIALPFAY